MQITQVRERPAKVTNKKEEYGRKATTGII